VVVSRVLVVRHDPTVPLGYLEAVLPATTEEVWLDRGDPLPDPTAFDGVIVLGGSMGAYDEDLFAFLAPQKVFLRKAVAVGVPVLGICLGCQLLADALGGAAYLAPGWEATFSTCELTPAGRTDPVVRHLGEPVFILHQDTWDPPPGSTVLAHTDRYLQAFRLGSALGIQPHPETPPEVAAEWLEQIGADRFAAVGVDHGQLVESMEAARSESQHRAIAMFRAWLAAI